MQKNSNLDFETDRKAREKTFHHNIFETGIHNKLTVFYSINESIYKDFMELLSKYTAKRTLEIGCGLGNYAIQMALKGANVSAIDICNYAIKQAQAIANRENLKIDFSIMDAENLEFKSNEFDLVYGIGILHHLNLNKVIPEIRRALKPGGKAIFREPMGHNPFINLFRLLTPRLHSRDEHPLKMKDLYFIEGYFPHFEAKFYYLFTIIAAPFYKLFFFNTLKKFFEHLDHIIFRILPWSRRFSWQVLLILGYTQK